MRKIVKIVLILVLFISIAFIASNLTSKYISTHQTFADDIVVIEDLPESALGTSTRYYKQSDDLIIPTTDEAKSKLEQDGKSTNDTTTRLPIAYLHVSLAGDEEVKMYGTNDLNQIDKAELTVTCAGDDGLVCAYQGEPQYDYYIIKSVGEFEARVISFDKAE